MKYTILSLMFSVWMMSSAQAEFITTWNTIPYPTIDLPIDPNYSGQYNYDVDIDDDGVYDFTGITGPFQYTFPSAGTHTIRIIGDYPSTYLIDSAAAQNEQLTSVNQWGAIEWKSMNSAFSGVNTDFIATDVPDLSQVTDMSHMFADSAINNLDVSGWDVSAVKNMSHMFAGAAVANPDVSSWDVSSVTDMRSMFNNAMVANPNVSDWDVSSVSNMSSMFAGAVVANPDVSNWDVSSVTSMTYMFNSTPIADPDVSNWDVSSVTNLAYMFNNASIANPDVSNWDVSSVNVMFYMFNNAGIANPDVSNWNVSSVTTMIYMFNGAANANPDLASWQIPLVEDMTGMFNNSGLSTRNFDSLLNNFATQNVMNNVNFSAASTPYCQGSGLSTLINQYGWTVTHGGLNCGIPDVSIHLPSNQVIDGNDAQLTVLVQNSGFAFSNNIEVQIMLDTTASNILWSCDAGPLCLGVGGGSGDVTDTISSMGPGEVVTYTIYFETSADDGDENNVSGSVTPEIGLVDGYPADNMFDKNIRIIKSIFENSFDGLISTQ